MRFLQASALLLTVVAPFPEAIAAGQPPEQVKHYGAWGVDVSGMDRTVRPGDDFAMYAWGKWYQAAVIPDGAPAAWNRMDMQRRNDARIRAVIEAAAARPDSPDRRLIGALYASYRNEDRLEALDAAPLREELAALRALPSKVAVARLMGSTPSPRATAEPLGLSLFEPGVAPGYDDPNRPMLWLRQSGLGLPDRDFYLGDPMRSQKAAYRNHAARLLRMAGLPEAESFADKIVDLETRIAGASWTATDSEDISKIFNPMTVAELERTAPGFPWRAYLDGAGFSGVEQLVVVQNSAFPKLARIFAETPLETLKAWLAFHKTDRAAPFLSRRFQEAHFAFWGTMRGMSAPPPRADRAVDVLSRNLVHPIAREYMAAYFSPETKIAIETMVGNIKAAMAERLRRTDWMGPESREEALAKLAALRVGIGHPDRWRDFSGLRLAPDDLYGNMQRIAAFNWAFYAGKLQRELDRDEWVLEPFALGAMAIYTRSLLTFSTGFLQPPYYDPDADPAVNYGAIGATIGHEIGHIFDAGGAQIDSRGRRRNWWTPGDEARFRARVDGFVRRLESYEETPGEPVDGKAALREQMAHLTGLKVALDGYHLSLGGKPAPVIDGFTGDQRFFLAFAQIWQGKSTAWFRKANSEHPPFVVIVNDVVRNIDGWYVAFGVVPGDRLYLKPEERDRIW